MDDALKQPRQLHTPPVVKKPRKTRNTSSLPGAAPLITTHSFLLDGPGTSGGDATRRAIRAQAARASAAQRTATIAKKKADKRKREEDGSAKEPRIVPISQRAGRARSSTGSVGTHEESKSSTCSSTRNGPVSRYQSPTSPDYLTMMDAGSETVEDADGTETVVSPGARSLLSAARTDPFESMPTQNWNESSAAITDHYLTHFAAAANSAPDMHGREAMRARFWPLVMSSNQLFEAMLLVSGTHLQISRKMPLEQASILRLRQNTLQSINHAVTNAKDGSLDPGTIGAIALLAGWDLEFGNSGNFDTHMQALRAIVAKQYGNIGESNEDRLPSIIEDLLISMGQDLPTFSSRQIYFTRTTLEPMKQQRVSAKPTQTVPGFKTVIGQAIVIPELLHRLSPLATFDLSCPDAATKLSEIASDIKRYDHYCGFGTKYSFLQTQQEDDMNAQGTLHIRAAGLALCAAYRDALDGSSSVNMSSTLSAVEDRISIFDGDFADLQPEILLGTVYENVLLWALTVICAVLSHLSVSQLRVVARLLSDLDITRYEAFESLLCQYVFPIDLLGEQAKALFTAATSEKTDGNCSISTRLTRYERTIQHPTNVADLTDTTGLGCRDAG